MVSADLAVHRQRFPSSPKFFLHATSQSALRQESSFYAYRSTCFLTRKNVLKSFWFSLGLMAATVDSAITMTYENGFTVALPGS